jgi:zinc/manganese transport system permease protein
MLAHAFVRNAYLAGTFLALACGLAGWFVVLRGQVFATDALTHVAFVGAIAAATIGLDERVGLFALTLALAAAIAGLGRAGQPDDVTIGIVFSWILGLGALFIALLATSNAGGTSSGITTANTLFGSIFGLATGQAALAAALALAVAFAILAARRPLLLATLDPEIATARGIPVRALGIGFLLALAIITAQGTQAVGALLLLGLVAAPAGAAHQLTTRPTAGLALSAALAIGATWGGLALSYTIPSLPPSSAIIGLATIAYLLATLTRRIRRSRGHRGGMASVAVATARGRAGRRAGSRGDRRGPVAARSRRR